MPRTAGLVPTQATTTDRQSVSGRPQDDLRIDPSPLQRDNSPSAVPRRRFLQDAAKGALCAGVALSRRRPMVARLASMVPEPAGLPLFGSAVIAREIRAGAPFIPMIVGACRVIVPNGQMHWITTRPTPETFAFGPGDDAVAFAREHNMLVRGHALIYHYMTAPWLEKMITPRNGIRLLQDHIRGLVGHFAGGIHSWDVVNEVVWPMDRRSDGLRNSFWLRNVGPEFIPVAFHTARAADPKALLGYNEHGIEEDGTEADVKRSVVLRNIRYWLAAGVPIDYFGVQSHLAAGKTYSATNLGQFLRELRDLGLRIFVTELDVDDRQFPADIGARDAAVAEVYGRYLDLVLTAVEVPIVTTWGLTDANSWLQRYAPRTDGLPQRPLPFDAQLKPKPAWRSLQAALKLS